MSSSRLTRRLQRFCSRQNARPVPCNKPRVQTLGVVPPPVQCNSSDNFRYSRFALPAEVRPGGLAALLLVGMFVIGSIRMFSHDHQERSRDFLAERREKKPVSRMARRHDRRKSNINRKSDSADPAIRPPKRIAEPLRPHTPRQTESAVPSRFGQSLTLPESRLLPKPIEPGRLPGHSHNMAKRIAALQEPNPLLSFNFHDAPWNYVLNGFAVEIGLPLEIQDLPSGRLTYLDPTLYHPEQALEILRSLLVKEGFTLEYSNERLVVRNLSSFSTRHFSHSPQEPLLKFDFQNAPWNYVLRNYAHQAGLRLSFESTPQGSFSYRDPNRYTHAEALQLINRHLLEAGYVAIRRGRTLVVVEPNRSSGRARAGLRPDRR